jgi:hypothetical protein
MISAAGPAAATSRSSAARATISGLIAAVQMGVPYRHTLE